MKTVLITWWTSWIGLECASIFAKHGYNLILLARNKDKLDRIAWEMMLADPTTKVTTYAVDISKREKLEQCFQDLNTELKEVSVLINSAWVAKGMNTMDTVSLDDIDEMVDTNIKWLLYVTRLILPYMLANWDGHVVNIGSTAGFDAYVGWSIYCGTKAAVNMMSKAMRMELRSKNIKISIVNPGQVETNFQLYRFDGNSDKVEGRVWKNIQLKPEDVAEVIYDIVDKSDKMDIFEVTIPHKSK